MAKQEETKFQRKLRIALEAEVGGFWWKVHGGMFQMNGLPDICGCVLGLYIAIETKLRENRKGVSGVQQTRIKEIREAGGLAFACYEDQLEWAVRKVKRHVEKYAIQSAEKSRKIIRSKKADRIIYGARDWEDNNVFSTRRSKTKKIK